MHGGLLQRQVATGGPSHFVGPFFSGANAAIGYLPLQSLSNSNVVLLSFRPSGARGEILKTKCRNVKEKY